MQFSFVDYYRLILFNVFYLELAVVITVDRKQNKLMKTLSILQHLPPETPDLQMHLISIVNGVKKTQKQFCELATQ